MSAPLTFDTATGVATVITTPYVGLTFFTEADSAVFFGRDDERRLIATTLLASRFTVIYGESGVGKSSLLRAGVVHDLRELALRDISQARSNNGNRPPSHIALVFSDWQEDPVPKLDEAIAEIAQTYGLTAGPTGATTFYELVEQWAEVLDTTIVIVLDQFEEYLLYHPSAEDDVGVGLAQAIANPDLSVRFALGIREDALAKLDRFEDLIPNLFDNYLRVDHLDEAAGEAAIRGPIDRYNEALGPGRRPVELDEALVEAVLGQVHTDAIGAGSTGRGAATEGTETSIEAPFLQLVMERLWEEDSPSGRLSKATLDRLGGAEKIVLSYLDDAMKALTRRDQAAAAAIFRDLVTPSGQKIAQTPTDLAQLAGNDEEHVRQMLELLAARRIVRPVAPAAESSDTRYEIFHDKLAAPILDWRARQVARRARGRVRLYAAGALVMAAVAAGCVVLVVQAKNAQKLARSQRFAARSVENLSVDPFASIRFALRALHEKKTPEAETALRTAVPSSPLRIVIRHPSAVPRARFSQDGKRIFASTDKTVVLSDSRTGRTLTRIGSTRNISTAELSRDGKRIVTAGWDNTVRVWNAETKAQIATFRNPKLNGAWFSPSGDRIAALSWDGQVRLWTPGSTRPPVVLERKTKQSLDVAAFDKNGDRLVVGGASAVALLYDTHTGRARPLKGHADSITAVAFSPDGSKVITGSDDGFAIIWNATTARRAAQLKETASVIAVAFSKDGSEAATSAGKRAHVWDARTGKKIADLRGHSDWVNDIEFRPDGNLVVTASADGTARVWDIGSETTLMTLLGNANIVETAAFSPSGKRVVTTSDDGTVRVWDVDTGIELRAHSGWVLAASFRPHSSELLTGGDDQQVIRWNARTGDLLGPIRKLPSETIFALRFSKDGKKLVIAGSRKTAYVRNAESGELVGELGGNTAAIADAAFNPNGTRVVTASEDGWAGIYNADGKQKTALMWLHRNPNLEGGRATTRFEAVNGVDWSVNGLIATAGADSLVGIWNGRTGRLLATYKGHHSGAFSPRFDPSGRFVVTASEDQTAQVWEIRRTRGKTNVVQRSVLPAHERIGSAAFSPDGKLVATAGADGTTRIWDWRNERILAVMHMHADFINSVEFSPDGTRLLSASDDGTAKIYRCLTCVPLEKLKTIAARQTKIVKASK